MMDPNQHLKKTAETTPSEKRETRCCNGFRVERISCFQIKTSEGGIFLKKPQPVFKKNISFQISIFNESIH